MASLIKSDAVATAQAVLSESVISLERLRELALTAEGGLQNRELRKIAVCFIISFSYIS